MTCPYGDRNGFSFLLFSFFFSFFPLVASTDKTVIPKSVNDIKLIHAGKILENSKTLAESTILFGDLSGGIITMIVVVQPPVVKKKSGLFNFLLFLSFSMVIPYGLYLWSVVQDTSFQKLKDVQLVCWNSFIFSVYLQNLLLDCNDIY